MGRSAIYSSSAAVVVTYAKYSGMRSFSLVDRYTMRIPNTRFSYVSIDNTPRFNLSIGGREFDSVTSGSATGLRAHVNTLKIDDMRSMLPEFADGKCNFYELYKKHGDIVLHFDNTMNMTTLRVTLHNDWDAVCD